MEKNSKTGTHGRETEQTPHFFYVCISSLQLYSNGDLLPKRLKGDYTPVSKTICLTEAQTKKNTFQILRQSKGQHMLFYISK